MARLIRGNMKEFKIEDLFSEAMKKAKSEQDFKTMRFVADFVTDSFFDEERDLNDVKFWLSTIGEKDGQ